MQNNVILVIAVIIGLAIGGGGAYAYTTNQIATLQSNINSLQTQVTSLTSETSQLDSQITTISSENTQLQTQVSTLVAEKTSLQTQLDELSSQNTELTTKYNSLLATIDAMQSSDWTQSISYNITAGTVHTQSFVLDKYGIIWEAGVNFSGTYVSMAHHYWYNGERFFVGSSGLSLTSVQDFRPTHGPQDFLYGTIKLEVSKDARSSDRIWVSCSILTQLPDISRGGSAYFDLES
ncbi:MAG: hypothetical protein ACW97O_17600 [Candidatus Thorarchaeota archaeon]